MWKLLLTLVVPLSLILACAGSSSSTSTGSGGSGSGGDSGSGGEGGAGAASASGSGGSSGSGGEEPSSGGGPATGGTGGDSGGSAGSGAGGSVGGSATGGSGAGGSGASGSGAGGSGGSAGMTISVPAPALHLTFDSDSLTGSTLADSGIAPSEDGMMRGSMIALSVGKLAQAVSCPGLDSDAVSVPGAFDPGTESYTLSFWFATPDVTTTQMLASKGNATSDVDGYSVFVEAGVLYVRGRQLATAADEDFAAQYAALSVNEWHHLTLVIDRDDSQIRGYLNGSEMGWLPGGGGTDGDVLLMDTAIESSEDFLICRRSTAGAPFDGLIDDLAIWFEALDLYEIQQVHSDGELGLNAQGE